MSNIVQAQNEVLSKAFGAECFIASFTNEVPFDEYNTAQGTHMSKISFYSKKALTAFNNEEKVQGCVLVTSATINTLYCTLYKYEGILLYGSELRKNLLKVMLKYNG